MDVWTRAEIYRAGWKASIDGLDRYDDCPYKGKNVGFGNEEELKRQAWQAGYLNERESRYLANHQRY